MKRFTSTIIIFLTAAFLCYMLVEKVWIGKIKDDIESILGSDYAIIALHIAGEDSHRPNLFRMLKQALIYEMNINGEYTSTGSGGFTGKKHHLAILISDNQRILFGEWSFRYAGLIFNDTFSSCDYIENLSATDQNLHSFDAEDITKREGLNYKDGVLNDNKIRFYYRSTKPGISDFD